MHLHSILGCVASLCLASSTAFAGDVIWQNVENLPDDLVNTADAWTAVRCEQGSNVSHRIACDDFELIRPTRITSIQYFATAFGSVNLDGHDWYIYEFGNDGLPGDLIAYGSDEPVDQEDTGWTNAAFNTPIYRNTMHPTDLVLEAGKYFIAFRTVLCITDVKYSIFTTRWANGNARALWNFGVLADGTVTDRWYTMDEFNGIVDQEWAFLMEGEPAGAGLRFADPAPGRSGEFNTFHVAGARPGNRVFIAGSLRTGSTNVPGCPGVTVELRRPTIIGSDVANVIGIVSINRFIPRALAGRTTYFQAVERATCAVSNLVEFVFE